MFLTRSLTGILVVTGLIACRSNTGVPLSRQARYRADSTAQLAIIAAGDSIYAQKKGYPSFAASLPYADSAQVIADRWGDRLMQARAVFAKARVYDAWNKDPQQTVRYFQRTVELYRPIKEKYSIYLYTKHLLAHAYDKVQDSTRATAVLTELVHELAPLDTTLLRQYTSTSEMALIATEVGNYPLAETILAHLTRRSWIRNDPTTYDFLDHYYLTRSRIDVLGHHRLYSPYVDSLANVFDRSGNLMDSLYYGANLARLRAEQGRYRQAYQYWQLEQTLDRRLNHDQSLAQMQQALLKSDLLAEKHKLAYQSAVREIRWQLVWGMGVLLLIISGLSLYLYRRNQTHRAQSVRLASLNHQLDEQVDQVQLLNKEIQHRIKNNLQMIYSLLQLQERKIDQPEAIGQLQQARLRVEAIAALHDQLIRQKGPFDLNSYLTTLIDSVVDCYHKPVVTHLNIQPFSLSASHYLPLALILTEWVTNSVKHAAIADDVLGIRITLSCRERDICVEYSDDGQLAQPPGQPVPNLGMDIVRLLCHQIKALLTVDDNNPYYYKLYLSNDQ